MFEKKSLKVGPDMIYFIRMEHGFFKDGKLCQQISVGLQLKAEVDKLKKQRSKIQKEIKSSNKRKIYEKDLKGKETSRDTECCNDKWANFTSVGVGLGLAPTVIKQVIKLHFQIMTQFQVNSILTSDRTLRKKKSKQDDFLEHQSILQQALTAKPCDDGNANGKPPTTQQCLPT